MDERKCEVPFCQTMVARGILMCREHWFQVPRPLRQEVNRAYDLYKTMRSMTALKEYNATVREAVKAVGA